MMRRGLVVGAAEEPGRFCAATDSASDATYIPTKNAQTTTAADARLVPFTDGGKGAIEIPGLQ